MLAMRSFARFARPARLLVVSALLLVVSARLLAVSARLLVVSARLLVVSARLLVVSALLLVVSGCGSCKTRGQDPIEFRGGEPSDDGLYYETSDAFGEYLHFPPGRTYDLIHGLVTTPYEVTSYIAFKRIIEQGDEGKTGNYAESAGNQVVVECQDEERVRVRNDTCADFYLRVILKANPDLSQIDRPCR